MAAPHVAAAAALYKLRYSGASAVEITGVLEKTAVDLDVYGRDDQTGYGLLDLAAALNMPPADTSTPVLSFSAPAADSEVTGLVKLTVQVTRPEEVQGVDFFLDGQEEQSKLVSVQQTSTGQVNYSYTWDTSQGPGGTPLADGQHTLYARAFGQSGYLGEAAVLPITVRNQVYTGLLLQVLDPTGAPSPGAAVYVLRKEKTYYYDNYKQQALPVAGTTVSANGETGGGDENGQPYPNEKEYYRVIMTDTTDSSGRVRIPGTLATDLKEYEVIAINAFDRDGQDYAFVYRRHYAAPCSDVIDGSRAVPVQLKALDKNDEILPYTLFSAAPLDEKGQRIFTVGPLPAVLEQGSKAIAYLDKGAYDLFAFWHPREATEIARQCGQTKDYTGPTYILTRTGVQVEAESDVTLDTTGTGQLKVQVPNAQPGDRGGIYLGVADSYDALGWEMEINGEELIVSAGKYYLSGWLEQSSADSRWNYDLEKDDPITVSAGSSQQIALGGGLTCQFQSVTENVYIGRDSFSASYKFADAGGNRLTWVYRSEKLDYDSNSSAYGGLYLKQLAAGTNSRLWQWQPGQTGWQEKVVAQNNYGIIWPQFSIYDSNDQLVSSGTSNWWSNGWWPSSNQPAGQYRAEVRLDNPGPIAGDQPSVKASVYFNLLDQAQPGEVEITITGRDGQPAKNAYLRILRRYVDSGCGEEPENGQEGEKYSYWGYIYSARSDASGIVRVPENLSLDAGGYNLAVVSVQDSVYGTTIASFPFTSLQELAESGLSLEDTV
ncbi:MAG: Ig-like domain-containing protein, partial [Bacillota bacterium]